MTLNLQKEFRTLAFPAGLILAAVLAAVWASHTAGTLNSRILFSRAAMGAFFLGVPLLASLPFGSEFHHRTIVLLLSAPVSRGRTWFDKWLAATLVLAALAAIVALAFSVLRWPINQWPIVPALMFMVMATCAAPLWTLVARSTIGGLTFTLWSVLMVEIAASYVAFHWNPGPRQDLFGRSAWLDTARALYAVGALYAGYALFSRFQVAATGVAARSAGQSQGSWAFIRARRSGAIFNYLRKELMLQRPAFLVAALFAVAWTLSTILVVTRVFAEGFAQALPAMLLAGYMPLVIVLAGTIPVGEDTSLGIREWHLTLPLSARTQWWLKLLVAITLAALLGVLLPGVLTAISGRVTHGRIGGAETFRTIPFLLIVIGATLLAFWSSTMFGDTLKAAVATGAAILGLILCRVLGLRLGLWMPFHMAWWYPLTVRFQLPAYYLQVVWMPGIMTAVAVVVATAVGLPQSLAAFRRVRVSPRIVLRNCAALALVVLALATVFSNAMDGKFRVFAPAREVQDSVMNLPALGQMTEGEPPRVVSLDELDRVRHLSPDARRWLANAMITVERLVTPGKPLYVVTIHFPNGFDDRFTVRLPR